MTTLAAPRIPPRKLLERATGLGSGLINAAAGGGIIAIMVLHWPAPVRVIDGDTVERRGIRYRLAGFDAPEIRQARCQVERDLGRAAAQRLRDLLANSPEVRLVPITVRPDRWGLVVARLEIGSEDLASVAVREGWAVPYNGRGSRHNWCGE